MRWTRLLVSLAWLTIPATAGAHRASDSYLRLSLEGDGLRGRWDIALRDLEQAIGLDRDGDARIVWGEVQSRGAEIAAYAVNRLALRADGRTCTARAADPLIDHHSDGAYAVLELRFVCPAPAEIVEVDYALFADLDPRHRGLVSFRAGGVTRATVLGSESSRERFALRASDPLRTLGRYTREGIWHVWIGVDHVLFLLCLMLPTATQGASRRASFLAVVKLVTAFSAAHSITLVLAALGMIDFPSRWVEASIAASVGLVALNNLFPVVRGESWPLAFGFGLVHGLGFASVLGDLSLPARALAPALLGFNLGVELGQLAIVAASVPILFALRETALYRHWLLPATSAGIALLASGWFVERAFLV